MLTQFDYKRTAATNRKTIEDRVEQIMKRNWPVDMASQRNVLSSFIFLPQGQILIGRPSKTKVVVPPPPPPQVTTEEIFLDSLSGEIMEDVYFPLEESTLMQMIATFEVKSVSVEDQEFMSRVGVTWGLNSYFSPPSTSGNEEEIHWYLFSMTLHARST